MIYTAEISHATPQRVLPTWFDEDGFVVETAHWTPAMAEGIAELEGIGDLSAKHWEIIHLVRKRYFSIGALPVMRLVCRAAGLDPQLAHRMFSSCRSLWRIASRSVGPDVGSSGSDGVTKSSTVR